MLWRQFLTFYMLNPSRRIDVFFSVIITEPCLKLNLPSNFLFIVLFRKKYVKPFWCQGVGKCFFVFLPFSACASSGWNRTLELKDIWQLFYLRLYRWTLKEVESSVPLTSKFRKLVLYKKTNIFSVWKAAYLD